MSAAHSGPSAPNGSSAKGTSGKGQLPTQQDGSLEAPLSRAGELETLLTEMQKLLVPYVAAADRPKLPSQSSNGTTHGVVADDEAVPNGNGSGSKGSGMDASASAESSTASQLADGHRTQPNGSSAHSNGSAGSDGAGLAYKNTLVDSRSPQELEKLLSLSLPQKGVGKDGLFALVRQVLQYSVNTWDQGFMDKLYASATPVGVVSELLAAALNTNLHVYQVSPVLTLIEKFSSRFLAEAFGLLSPSSPHGGGISQPGGSAANATSIVVARNTLFPQTKEEGLGNLRLRLFTSAHGHYSLEKAAQMFGLGSNGVVPVPVDQEGRMIPSELDRLVRESKDKGETPFYVNATAGTTVLGSYDPFHEISAVCKTHNLWMHVDGSWGGTVVLNPELKASRLAGIEKADSVTLCPHKMMMMPVTCSFMLARDMRQVWKAMTLPAGYLFHSAGGDDDEIPEIYDLADLTPQCGRKGDSLKFFLSLSYYGLEHYSALVATAFRRASALWELLDQTGEFEMVSSNPTPCLQVCFYYKGTGGAEVETDAERVSVRTATMARRLIDRGYMVDYAPGKKGKFFRVVVNGQTRPETLQGLVQGLREVGREVEQEGL